MVLKVVVLAILICGASTDALAAESASYQPAMNAAVVARELPYSSYYGVAQERLEILLRDLFNAGLVDLGPRGVFYISAVRSLRQEFGFALDPDIAIAGIPHDQHMHYGLHASQSTEKWEPPKLVQEFFRAGIRGEISPFVGLYADAYAYYCSPAEPKKNEQIANRLVAAKSQSAFHFRLLDFAFRLHESKCISSAAYTKLVAQLANLTKRSLDSLDPADQILASFVLVRSGAAKKYLPFLANRIVQNFTYGNDGALTTAFGRRDVFLAGAYVVSHVLLSGDPTPPQVAIGRVIDRIRGQGGIFEDTPFKIATQTMYSPAKLLADGMVGTASLTKNCQCTVAESAQ